MNYTSSLSSVLRSGRHPAGRTHKKSSYENRISLSLPPPSSPPPPCSRTHSSAIGQSGREGGGAKAGAKEGEGEPERKGARPLFSSSTNQAHVFQHTAANYRASYHRVPARLYDELCEAERKRRGGGNKRVTRLTTLLPKQPFQPVIYIPYLPGTLKFHPPPPKVPRGIYLSSTQTTCGPPPFSFF